MAVPVWTVGVLLFGSHTDLHKRCLSSIVEQINYHGAPGVELRVGMNAICDETKVWIAESMERPKGLLLPYVSDQNILKYPMMRRMFWDEREPIRSEYLAWFDDDSYLDSALIGKNPNWFARVTEAFAGVDYMGSAYTMGLTRNRQKHFQNQPWANPKIPVRKFSEFMQGAWWCLRTDRLREVNYPFEGLEHRGGDVALGECARQQGWVTKRWKCGVRINADEKGNESKAERRGFRSNVSWGDVL